MPPEKSPFINVDELMPGISVEQAARFYGVPLPELHHTGKEVRSRCFLNCGKTEETGDRVLAIEIEHPARQWKCHAYGCQKSGNLVSLCDLMKGGADAGGRPRGERFKAIAADLRAMAGGVLATDRPSVPQPAVSTPPPESPRVNRPLHESDNERARALTVLDSKFVREVTAMPPGASAYFRKRPFLSPEMCRDWRVGYLPRDAGGDTAGGTMRGKVVYAFHSREGNVLTWFGRDPEFEEKHRRWEASDRSDREPEKFHFVKGFHRGIELFGQDRIGQSETADALRALGLILVEGPNDVIRLATLGVPAVALCSNSISREQAQKAAELARQYADGIVTIFLDCDAEGERGMRQALGYLAQLTPVRLAWTSQMHGGKFTGRQPESLSGQEWAEIATFLTRQAPPLPDSEPDDVDWRAV